MRKVHIIVLSLFTALLYTILFYKKGIGLNLFVFEMILIPVMLFLSKPLKFNFFTILLTALTVVSAFSVMMVSTIWGVVINYVLLFTLATALNNKGSRSFFHLGLESFPRGIMAQVRVFQRWQEDGATPTGRITIRKILYMVILPIIVLIFFFTLYIKSSSTFYNTVEPFFQFISKLNFPLILFYCLGIVVANVLLVKTAPMRLYKQDISSTDILVRRRKPYYYPFKKDGLLMQNKAGIVLLGLLNLLILFFNYLDITTIWFNFTWDGSTLKEFVHEGTWILVFSVVVSAAIALYFFHNNLNFYSKNKTLKALTIAWILQNFVMTVSVIIRNYWYINYFGLAYKRIAVMFFLLLVAIGLLCIIFKILKVRSTYFLLRTNGLSLMLVLFVSSLFNWDVIIAKYNFEHYKQSFVEYRYMARLNNSALPYIVKSLEELEDIDTAQEEVMPFDTKKDYFWGRTSYHERVEQRKTAFLESYPERSFLEWNYAEYVAYKKLMEGD